MILYQIYYIFLFTLFSELFFTLGLPRPMAVSIEILIFLLFLQSMLTSKNAQIPHLWYGAGLFLLTAVFSAIVNGSSITECIFSLRLLLRFYLFYLCVTILNFDDVKLKKLNKILAILLLCELPVIAVKFYYFGVSEETMGAYSRSGAETTMIPMTVIFYLAGYYFLHRARVRYILVGIFFVIFSIVGRKRAVAFLYPIQFVAIFYYIYVKGKGAKLPQKVSTGILVFAVIVVTTSCIFYVNDTLNPERKVGGTVDVEYAVKYAKDYTTRYNYYGYSGGRFSTTKRVFVALWKSGFSQFVFGYGPGKTIVTFVDAETKIKREKFYDDLKISYGITSASRIALEYGVLGVVIFSLILFMFVRMCLFFYRYEVNSYWKAFAAGSVGFSISMLFFFFAYHHSAFWGDTMPLLYFYAMAVVFTRIRRIRSKVN